MFGLSKRMTTVIGVGVAVLGLYLLSGRQAGDASEDADPAQCRVTVVADVLNVRAAPALDAPIVGRFVKDTETDAGTVVQNGFRQLDEHRWASDEYLTPKEGHDCAS